MTARQTGSRHDPLGVVDLLIVGSGIAGLFTAAQATAAGLRVAVVTKGGVQQANTRWAQGGIAAAVAPTDSVDAHIRDTLATGAGLSDASAVAVLCQDGPARIADLIAYGVRFDRESGGDVALALEGAHSAPRVLHARGDATGAEIEAALARTVRATAAGVREGQVLIDLVLRDGRCVGARLLDRATGRVHEQFATTTVLATGGGGYLFAQTTNPAVATADGVAAGLRAGAVVADLEFLQFHPTALAMPGAPRFLISEATRGAGAWLRNDAGDRFMSGIDPRAELAPRDVVSRAILAEIGAGRGIGGRVWLDMAHLPTTEVRTHFPMISRVCARHGIDITRDRIPVAPAAHYMIGGLVTDRAGRTSVPGLYAIGECASTGVHGANRLASNSLLEAVVFGARAVAAITNSPTITASAPNPPITVEVLDVLYGQVPVSAGRPSAVTFAAVRRLLWDRVGIVRTPDGLAEAGADLAHAGRSLREVDPKRHTIERANAVAIGWLMARAALARTESRGTHYRADIPVAETGWEHRLAYQLAAPAPLRVATVDRERHSAV